jgi:predicted DNA-binding transcriptional regulator AlpA
MSPKEAKPIDPAVFVRGAEEFTGLERSTIHRHCKAGTFPPPFYIAGRRAWRRSQLEAWLRAQEANTTPLGRP